MKLKPHVSLAGSYTNSPFRVFFVHQRAKNCPSMTKINRGQDTHYLSMCTQSEDPILVKHELNMLCNLLSV